MAIYHLEIKAISRSAGRSSVAAAAYRAGEKLIDERQPSGTGTFDFRKKSGVLSKDIILPSGINGIEWALDRSRLWNAAEQSEKRKDSCTAKEIIVAVPCELNNEQARSLVIKFAQAICDDEGCVIDACGHAPGKDGDRRNHHFHLLKTVRKITPSGLGEKLDSEKAGRKRKDDLKTLREKWEVFANEALAAAGHNVSIDHRSHKDRGINEMPSTHLGPTATAIERKGRKSRRGFDADLRNLEWKQIKEIDKAIAVNYALKRELEAELEAEKIEETNRVKKLQENMWRRHAAFSENFTKEIEAEIRKSVITLHGVEQTPNKSSMAALFTLWQAPDGACVHLFKTADAKGRKAAFTEIGNRIRVQAPDAPGVLRASLERAKERWPSGITITGDRSFRIAAEAEAKKIGLRIHNPIQQHAIDPSDEPVAKRFRPK